MFAFCFSQSNSAQTKSCNLATKLFNLQMCWEPTPSPTAHLGWEPDGQCWPMKSTCVCWHKAANCDFAICLWLLASLSVDMVWALASFVAWTLIFGSCTFCLAMNCRNYCLLKNLKFNSIHARGTISPHSSRGPKIRSDHCAMDVIIKNLATNTIWNTWLLLWSINMTIVPIWACQRRVACMQTMFSHKHLICCLWSLLMQPINKCYQLSDLVPRVNQIHHSCEEILQTPMFLQTRKNAHWHCHCHIQHYLNLARRVSVV